MMEKISNIQNQKNENINEIKIVEAPIPVQAPQIRISPVEIAIGRYQKWLSDNFEKQKQQSGQERRGLKERELSLRKLGSKIFRKIEELSKNVLDKFSASNLQNVFTNSLTPALFLLGTSILPSFWTPLMKFLASFEYGIRSFFGLKPPEGVSPEEASKLGGWTFVKRVKKFLGTTDETGEKSFLRVLGKLMLSGVEHFMEKTKLIFKERGQLMDNLEKPDKTGVLEIGWDMLMDKLHLGDGKNPIGEWLSYFGDILGIALGGEAYMSWKMSKEQQEETGKNIKENELINHNSAESLKKRGITIHSRIDKYINEEGEFDGTKDPLTASITLSNFTVSAIRDTSKQNIGSTQYGLKNLIELSEQIGDKVPVIQEFVNLLDHNTKQKLMESGDIEIRPGYSFIKFRGDAKLIETGDPVFSDYGKVQQKGLVFMSPRAIKAITDGKDSYSGKGFERIRDLIEKNYKEKKKTEFIPRDIKTDLSDKYLKNYETMMAAQRNLDLVDSEDTEWNNFINQIRYHVFSEGMGDITFGQTVAAEGEGVNQYNRGKKFDIKSAIERMYSPVRINVEKFSGTVIPVQGTEDYKGGCATAVRNFLEAGGLDTRNHPISARDYNSFLPQLGFCRINESETPRPGDILVNDYPDHGHIQMFNGHDWVSDTKQNRASVRGSRTFWRFPQEGDNIGKSLKQPPKKVEKVSEKESHEASPSPSVNFVNGITGTSFGEISASSQPEYRFPMEFKSNQDSFSSITPSPMNTSNTASSPVITSQYYVIDDRGMQLLRNIEETSKTIVDLKSK